MKSFNVLTLTATGLIKVGLAFPSAATPAPHESGASDLCSVPLSPGGREHWQDLAVPQ